VEVEAMPLKFSTSLFSRLWQCGQLWSQSQRALGAFSPDVVVGFGGWVSGPVLLAANHRRIRCLLHEQNVQVGCANRWLIPWVDRVAISFEATRPLLRGAPSVLTGLPIRVSIGNSSREAAAQRFGLEVGRPTLLIMGGSQGARTINRLAADAFAALRPEEVKRWQVIHVTGAADESLVRSAYASRSLRAYVAPFLAEMELAYAHTDLVISRAGASTIAELARCGKPAVLIPYPHAGAHQRANARVVASVGGAVILEESDATPARFLETVRRALSDPQRLAAMADGVKALAMPDATDRLVDAITTEARKPHGSTEAPRKHGMCS
jgi:UDP-N-acetylglucosamine--N-acetylmuramyl-(pentapeptide) pyrophosphoryl-undecaprenol N-acetylglucosamine transferase